MLLTDIARRRVIFVGGKGGVGKTSLTSALALARARQGARVLVVSTDPAHNLGHLWQRAVGNSATLLWAAGDGPGRVDGIEIDPAATVDRHLAAVSETMTRMLPDRLHRAARAHLEQARDAPGTHESAVLERVAETLELGLDRYDLVLFDTAPSGHTLHLLAMPERMTGWTEQLLANRDRSERFRSAYGALGGTKDTSDRDAELRRMLLRRRARFSLIRDLLDDGDRTGFVLVFVAEPVPIAESIEVAASLRDLGIVLIGAVANRLSPADLMPLRRARENTLIADLSLGAPLTRIPLVDEVVGLPALEAIAAELTPAP
ncbi:ArsA family ATPase [Microbacterium amylolyticum]|uniref:Arsenite-transporting ATPase n=1 Tax=Microbacterium amylolyticum TaxID=936337 RepID=A0ABS4ZHU7_9MICO|nr:ArsA family ATPase [Microbacterium amylolyticum]MBP2436856.1 arsenite-transporting ATPase [Microbacterium amylolyticum]